MIYFSNFIYRFYKFLSHGIIDKKMKKKVQVKLNNKTAILGLGTTYSITNPEFAVTNLFKRNNNLWAAEFFKSYL